MLVALELPALFTEEERMALSRAFSSSSRVIQT